MKLQQVRIGEGTEWGGIFPVFAVLRKFKNGKIAVKVAFYGKTRVFHVFQKDFVNQ